MYRNWWAAEGLHPEVLRELTDTTARSLPWRKGHTNLRTCWSLKRPTSQSSSRKQEGGTGELQISQPHLGPWQCDGANPTEAIYKCVDDKTMIRDSSCEFTKGKYSLAKSCWKGQLCEQGEQMLFSLTSARLLTPYTMVSLQANQWDRDRIRGLQSEWKFGRISGSCSFSDILQGLTLASKLLNDFINDIEYDTKSNLPLEIQ